MNTKKYNDVLATVTMAFLVSALWAEIKSTVATDINGSLNAKKQTTIGCRVSISSSEPKQPVNFPGDQEHKKSEGNGCAHQTIGALCSTHHLKRKKVFPTNFSYPFL